MCMCQCHTSFTSYFGSVLTTKKKTTGCWVKNLHLLSLFSNFFNPSRHYYQSLPPPSTPAAPVSTLQPSFWAPAAVLWDPPKHWRSRNGTVRPLVAYQWQKSIEATNMEVILAIVLEGPFETRQQKNTRQNMWKQLEQQHLKKNTSFPS